MPFELSIPRAVGGPLTVSLQAGDLLFVLGANGTGKSSLMFEFNRRFRTESERITAHRQNWLSSNAVAVTPQQRVQNEEWFRGLALQPASRWSDEAAQQRTYAAIFDVVNAENQRAREIQAAVDAQDIPRAQRRSSRSGPFKIINEILGQANIDVRLSVGEGEKVEATKNGHVYSAAELSDGERNALLIAARILTAKPGLLLLIDEPERHLHRSIISPLLTQLIAQRPDCTFIVSTHETMLPTDNPQARTLLVRGCTYSQTSEVTHWDVDLVPAHTDLDEPVLRDILGARRKLLFVEGTANSLDRNLYGILFPQVSLVSKGSCHDVVRAVCALREATALNWVRAFGVIDCDARPAAELAELLGKGIYAVAVYSIESIYYHPDILLRIAARQSAVDGIDSASRLADAKSDALAAIAPHQLRLSRRICEKNLRDQILKQLPGQPEIMRGGTYTIPVDIDAAVTREAAQLQNWISAGNLAAIVARYPIRETAALDAIARKLGFSNQRHYEGAVRKLLTDEPAVAALVRAWFGTLNADLAAQ